MKYSALFYCLLFLFTASTYAKNTTDISNDERIRSLMIGSWVPDPSKEAIDIWTITTYKSDGTLDFIRYESSVCKSIIAVTKAGWRILNGNLVIVVHESTTPRIFPTGYTVIDKVVSIDMHKTILKGKDGKPQYRIRSNKCLTK